MPEAHADLVAAWDFVRWADDRAVEAARSVPDPAEYARDRPISHGSVHKLLLHMMAGQADWLATWRGGGDGLPDTSAAACTDLDAIARTWPIVHAAVGDFLANLFPADLARPVRFARGGHELALPLSATITHLLDHATYHRGQLNTLVTLAGGRRVRFSYWVYALRKHPQAAGATDAAFLWG
jgi:uncharacterized damage-inducible protein DinB